MEEDPFNPKSSKAIARRTPAIWTVLRHYPSTPQRPRPDAAPDTWGAQLGLEMVTSPTTPDWVARLFPDRGRDLIPPDFVEPGDVDESWCYRFYLGLLCALAFDMDDDDENVLSAEWGDKAYRGLIRALRTPTRPGTYEE